jgi:hypothetical protein
MGESMQERTKQHIDALVALLRDERLMEEGVEVKLSPVEASALGILCEVAREIDMAKSPGVYVKPSQEVIDHFTEEAKKNRRTLADEIGLFLDNHAGLDALETPPEDDGSGRDEQ